MKIPSVNKQKKFLKHALSKTNLYDNEAITLNYSFYSELKLSESEAIYIAKALNDKGLISFVDNRPMPFYKFVLTDNAYSFIPDLNNYLFHFWFPILISCALSVAAILISIAPYILK